MIQSMFDCINSLITNVVLFSVACIIDATLIIPVMSSRCSFMGAKLQIINRNAK